MVEKEFQNLCEKEKVSQKKAGQTFDGVYFENIEILVAFPILVEIRRT